MDAVRHFGEAWLKRVQASARPLLLPPGPEVPERAAAAASLARRIASLPPHERLALPSGSSTGASPGGDGDGALAFQPTRPWGEQAEEVDERFYEQGCDPVRLLLETFAQDSATSTLKHLGVQSGKRLLQLDVVTERLSHQVMEHYEEMVQGMELVTELERDLRVVNIIVKNGRRHLASAMHDVTRDLKVAATIRKKQALLDTVPLLRKMQRVVSTKAELDGHLDNREFAKALRMCTQCLILVDGCSELAAMQEVSRGLEDWLSRAVEKVDTVLLESCRRFDPTAFTTVAEAYAVMDDPGGLADKIQTYFSQLVLSESHDVVTGVLERFSGGAIGAARKRSRLPYSDLCAALSEAAFRECLHRTLEVLFDLFASYHSMLSWQPPKVLSPPQFERSPTAHRRSGSAASLQSAHVLSSAPTSPRAAEPRRSASSSSAQALPLSSPGPPGAQLREDGAAPDTPLPAGPILASLRPLEATPAQEAADGVNGGSNGLAASVEGRAPSLRARARATTLSAPSSLQELSGLEASFEGAAPAQAGGTGTASAAAGPQLQVASLSPALAGLPGTRQQEQQDLGRSPWHAQNGERAGSAVVAAAVARWEEVIAAQMQKGSPRASTHAAPSPSVQPTRGEPLVADVQCTPPQHGSGPILDAGGPSSAGLRSADGSEECQLASPAGAPYEGDFGLGIQQGAELEAAQKGSPHIMEGVKAQLLRGRKGLWELAARRVAALLACEALSNSSAHSFLQALELVQKFILAGELFSGAEAVSLRASLAKQSEKHFQAFHRQNLEVLRMMLERETWQRVPDSAARSSRVGLTGHGAPLGAACAATPQAQRRGLDAAVSSPGPRPTPGVSPALGEPKSSFGDWMAAGNPFSAEKGPTAEIAAAATVLGNGRSAIAGDPDRRTRDNAGAAQGPLAAAAPLRAQQQQLEAAADLDLDDDAEDEELLADFIDEESQRPARARKAVGVIQASTGGQGKVHSTAVGEGAAGGSSLTSSCLSIVRFMERYARLMQILQHAAPEVFKGLCQLFDLYLLTVFRVFGHRNALVHSRPGNDNPTTAILTPRLRATLVRIHQGLEEYRNRGAGATPALGAASMVASVADILSGAGLVASGDPAAGGAAPLSSPVGSAPSQIVAPTNLYGLRERCVAVESLLWLADVMRRSRPRFQSLLPQSALPAMDHFFARTVDAVPDLREHVYRALARLLLNLYSYPDRIGNVKWEVKDLGVEHNHYADHLLSEFKLYAHRLAHAGISKQVQNVVLEYGVDVLAEVLVEGFSRVRRCTNEGRALMSLDLQVLINGIAPLMPNKSKPNLQIVENYIKAFYLPETEYLHWARTHSEYTQSQILGLINLTASMNNWKRKTRTDIIERIEAGDV